MGASYIGGYVRPLLNACLIGGGFAYNIRIQTAVGTLGEVGFLKRASTGTGG